MRTQLLADLFREMGETYKEESYGFDMSDADFAELQANFAKLQPAFGYRQEKHPIGQETVISVQSVLMHGQTARVTLRFASRDTFYGIEYMLNADSGRWKIVDRKILYAS